MTFDKWIDAVNASVRASLGDTVRTEELGWDSALWVGPAGTAAATLGDDEKTARFVFDRGEAASYVLGDSAATPEVVGAAVVAHISR